LIDTSRGDTLVFHLGMSGHWRIDPDEISKHDHLVIDTNDHHRVVLNDPRRFGSLDLLRTAELDAWPTFAALGPEPFDIEAAELKRRLVGRKAPIKQMLLDQNVIAGLGNIYVCEALHRSHISPRRAAGSISRERLERLVPAIKDVLHESIAAGGSTLRDFAAPSGELGYFPKSFAAYNREGEACACGGTIKRVVQGGRSTFYCPKCQR
jgi:formamidopyrimidine-DNA glycosylase